MTTIEKTCTRCHVRYDDRAAAFYQLVNGAHAGEYPQPCKACQCVANLARGAARKTQRALRRATEGKTCRKCGVHYPDPSIAFRVHRATGWYSSPCLPCARKVARAWKEAHPDACRALTRKSYAKCIEKRRAASRAYSQRNRAKSNERVREWIKNNPERDRARWMRYLANKRGAAGTSTPEQIIARVALFGGRCWMCRAPWEEIDHVIPLSRGGSNWPANLRPACTSCNCSKRARRHTDLLTAPARLFA